MQKIKNRLIIAVTTLLFNIIFYVFTATAAENSGFVDGISDRMVISIKGSDITYELSDIYIPGSIKNAAIKANELILGKEVIISNISKNVGRHGAYYATIKPRDNQKSLQEILLENGLAFVYFIDAQANAKALFASEDIARRSKLGIWANDDFKVINSTEIESAYKDRLGKFVIVEGIVNNSYTSKKNLYINFGTNWKTDFSIQLENKTLKNLHEFSAENLKGKKVSVRGWLEDYNGPFMKIYNLDNLHIISAK